jgi:uncharacterized protein involved in type VI secretion and phage assembly
MADPAYVQPQTALGNRFFGKYRGTVTDNNDPERLGRVQVQVPEVLGDVTSGWAVPCAPYAGAQVGLFVIPATGAGVWVEFEAGDPSKPIWTGGWWDTGGAPPPIGGQPSPDIKILRTTPGLMVAIDDQKQAITISDSGGDNQVVIDASSGTITVKAATQIVLEAPKITEGSKSSTHSAVFGDNLLSYLSQLVTSINTHMHPGQANSAGPVSPAPPSPPANPPTNSILSTKVMLE